MRRILPICLVMVAAALAACGGGGGGGGNGGSNPPPPPPPTTIAYAAQIYTRGVEITQLRPTVTGTAPTGYSISPTLPAGLQFDPNNGSVYGTPSAIQAANNYTVTATTASGTTTATLSITVNDAAPGVDYARNTYVLVEGVPMTPLVPATTGGTVVDWSVNPALPAGLALSSTGEISGTPAALSAAANYVITAANSGGSDTFTLNLAVRDGLLLDVGHVSAVRVLRYSNNRVMSVDEDGRARLHDAQTGARVLAVQSSCVANCGNRAELAGDVFVVRQPDTFDVYSAQTGALQNQISSPANEGAQWQVATDGSYLVETKTSGLRVWSTGGASWLSRTGNHTTARIFPAPEQLRIGNSPGITNAVELVALPAGTSTQTPSYIGTFHSWFLDGARFLTRANNTVLVYSSGAVLEDTAPGVHGERLAGRGDWFWNHRQSAPYDIGIYEVGSAGTEAANYPTTALTEVVSAPGALGVLGVSTSGLSVIDLSGPAPAITGHDVHYSPTTFAALSAGQWVYANMDGVVAGGPGTSLPPHYTTGKVRSIAGGENRVAIATASGEIHVFDTANDPEGVIDFSSSRIRMSESGSVLAAEADIFDHPVADRVLRVYALPSQAVLAEFPGGFTPGGRHRHDFVMSADGDILGTSNRNPSGALDYDIERQTFERSGTPVWNDVVSHDAQDIVDHSGLSFRLSPSGTGVAAPNIPQYNENAATNLYLNDALTANVPGAPVGWIDDSRLLLNRYVRYGARELEFRFDGVDIVDASGQLVASPPLPEIHELQAIDANLIYSPELNVILNVTTGDTTWSSGAVHTQGLGAVAGDQVVFLSGAKVVAVPR
jgi:hypothetical protein